MTTKTKSSSHASLALSWAEIETKLRDGLWDDDDRRIARAFFYSGASAALEILGDGLSPLLIEARKFQVEMAEAAASAKA